MSLKAIDYFLHGINHLENDQTNIQKLELISKLCEHIIPCASSNHLSSFQQLSKLLIKILGHLRVRVFVNQKA